MIDVNFAQRWDSQEEGISSTPHPLLFGTGSYRDDAMTPHVRLHQRMPMSPAHFERWVELFSYTVDELFTGPKAEEAKMRARSIAGVMAHRVAMASGCG